MAQKKDSQKKKKSVSAKHEKRSDQKSDQKIENSRLKNSSSPNDSNTEEIINTYKYTAENVPILITVAKKKGEFVPTYDLQISNISKTTEIILEKVRLELIRRVSLGTEEIGDVKKTTLVEDKFAELIDILIQKYFPDSDEETSNFLRAYLKINSLGLGNIELLMNDELLEEIVINQSSEPIWVYHRKHGWLKTNVFMKTEEQTRHYASIIGRRVGRQITILTPLLDAHLGTGDRVNATLSPVSTSGNTITIRKFSKDPWTITKFLRTKTISYEAAALIWMAIQYELSAIIAGGTASGKTSALNVFANFFPPNQRIISIEDTREIILPKFLHWVPLNTTLPNPEGKGEISMGDLLVNSLRMRPDRILVGEVRRKRETETLFEAIHTGHSVYATFHANSAKEAVERLTNAPIDVPKIMLPAISLIIVQFRNRRSGNRRTFQVAEILANGEANVILQYDVKKDILVRLSKSKSLYENISLFTGMNESEINKDLKEKTDVLNYLVKYNIDDVDGVGRIMAEYYTQKNNLMTYVKSGKNFIEEEKKSLEASAKEASAKKSTSIESEPIYIKLDDKSAAKSESVEKPATEISAQTENLISKNVTPRDQKLQKSALDEKFQKSKLEKLQKSIQPPSLKNTSEQKNPNPAEQHADQQSNINPKNIPEKLSKISLMKLFKKNAPIPKDSKKLS